MASARIHGSTIGLVAALAGCGGQTEGDRWTEEGGLISYSPLGYLIVVDDAKTLQAAELRTAIAQSIAECIEHEWTDPQPKDPARWNPLDVRVVFGFASAGSDERFRTSFEGEELVWQTNSPTAEEQSSFASLIAAAVEALPAELSPFAPIQTLHDGLELIVGQRIPRTAEEQRLSQWVDESSETPFLVIAGLASLRDDAAPPASLALPVAQQSPNHAIVVAPVIPPGEGDGDSACVVRGSDALGEWSDENAFFHAIAADPDCLRESNPFLASVVEWSSGGCVPRPRILSDGRADCDVLVQAPRCAPEKGWVPTDNPPDDLGRETCRIPQLEGSLLAGCRQSLECPECGSGWCVTEVPDLLLPVLCEEEDEIPGRSFRFTGGAGIGPGHMRMSCVLQD